jgi:hypothetical protein
VAVHSAGIVRDVVVDRYLLGLKYVHDVHGESRERARALTEEFRRSSESLENFANELRVGQE